MMKKHVSRSLAAALCLVMALSLFVPALAATPMGFEAAEVPAETSVVSGPIVSVGGTVTPAVAEDEPAGLAAACCSASSPHEANATIECSSSAKEHYCAASTGSYVNVTLKLVGDYASLKVSGKSGLSNVSIAPPVLAYKHKVTAGGTATVTLSNKDVITLTMVDPNAHVHAWDDGVITTQPTCGEPGEKTYTCSGCGETKTEVIPATGAHTWSDTHYETITEPTCTATGLAGKVCTVCGEVSTAAGNTKTLPMVDHTYKNGTSGICLVCNYDSATHSTHTHTWDTSVQGADSEGWVVTTPATCLAAGTKTRTCSTEACGKVETGTVAKLAHSFTGPGNTCVNGCGQTQTEVAGNMAAQGGWLESAYVEWPIQSGVTRYEVYVKEASAASYPDTPIDDELIRRYPGDLMRADALGLVGNKSYKMKVVALDSADNEIPGMTLESGPLEVKPHIREGYAFWSGSTNKTASGAYNDDGTLKENAVVVYVDNSNFDKVQVPLGGQTLTGVQELVAEGGASKVAPGTPICIRILGTIDTTGFPKGSWASSAEGLQVKGGSNTLKNLTIEGVGNDAVLDGFGILIRNCVNVEVRNFAVLDFADDGISVDTNNYNLWIHNLDLFYGGPGGDSDQAKGDGSVDIKKSKYCTVSFVHFWDSGKSCLLDASAGSGTSGSDYMTYHHNWFDHSDSRHPRVRNSTHTHVYNNYYDGNAKYGIGATTGCDIFAENNYFRSCKDPMLTSLQGTDAAGDGTFSGNPSGFIKAYGNTMTGTYKFIPYTAGCGTNYDAYVTATKDETIPSTVKGASGNTYNNFDTNSSEFYLNDYAPETAEAAMNTVTAYAGRVQGGDLKWTFDNAVEDTNYGIISELKAAVVGYKTSLVSVGGHVDGSVSGGNIAVSKVTLNTTAVTLKPGETVQLSANIVPSTATDKAVTWDSNVPAVATVDDDGLVTAVANGSATITVTTEDGGKTATCSVTVSDGSGGGDVPTPGPTGTTHTLDASSFKMTEPYNDDPTSGKHRSSELSADELAAVANGMFTMVGKINKRTSQDSQAGATVQFFDLGKGGANGISFTTSAAGTVTVKFSSSGSSNTSAVVVKDASDALLTLKDSAATFAKVTGTSAQEFTFVIPAAGTYTVYGSTEGGAASDARLSQLTVTETAGGDTPTPSVDKSALVTAISNANAAKAGVVVSANGSDVSVGTFWVPQSAMTALNTAITTATGVNADDTATQIEVNNAVRTLNGAITTFNSAKSDGKLVEELDSGYLDGTATNLHYTVNTAGAVTVSDTIPTGNLVFATYWKGDKFLGAKTVTKDAATTALSGWTSIKLIWIDAVDAPQCLAVTITAGGGTTPDPGPVDPTPTPGTTEVHTFESKNMTTVATKNTTWTNADVIEVATNKNDPSDTYFKALVNNVTRVDASNKTWPADADKGAGYESTQRFNPGSAFSSKGEGIKFTTTSAGAKVQIWWVQTGGDYWKDGAYTPVVDGVDKNKDLRQVIISKGTDKTATKAVGSADAHTGTTAGADDGTRVKQGDVKYDEFTLADAGTYIVGGEGGPVYLFKIVVTETK